VELIYTKIYYFGKTKTGILSPNPGNTTQIIVEKNKAEKLDEVFSEVY
jgi:hypothetical protein